MLKDRRALLENEIAKQKALCGKMYLEMIRFNESASAAYDAELTKLTRMMAELSVISQMISEGHQ